MSDQRPAQRLSASLEGADLPCDTPAQCHAAIEQAFDYRGDVTVHLADGQAVEGYLFDRSADAPQPFLRLLRRDDGQRLLVPYAQVRRVAFTGRDPASGKSWETWVRKYQQAKAEGRTASLDAEPLD